MSEKRASKPRSVRKPKKGFTGDAIGSPPPVPVVDAGAVDVPAEPIPGFVVTFEAQTAYAAGLKKIVAWAKENAPVTVGEKEIFLRELSDRLFALETLTGVRY